MIPGLLSGAAGKNTERQKSLGAGRLAPPDLVIGLLELRFLAKIQNRKHNQPDCGDSQQDGL